MPALIILVGLALMAYLLRSSYYKQPIELRTRWLTIRVLWGLVALCAIAAATGRLHVIGALTSPLVPIAWQLYTRFKPLGRDAQQTNPEANDRATQNTSTMTKKQALNILGLSEGASVDEIKRAHRELIAKFHPDKGGSEFLAAQINQARDLLLD